MRRCRSLPQARTAEKGWSTLRPCQATVGDPVRFIVRYTAGPAGLPAGARVRLAVPKAFTCPQDGDENSGGHVAIVSAARPARVESIELSEETHEAHDIFCTLPEGLGAGESLELRYDTETTTLYPGVLAAQERRFWYSRLPPLAVAVATGAGKPSCPSKRTGDTPLSSAPPRPKCFTCFCPGAG